MLKKNYHVIPAFFVLATSLVFSGCDSQSQEAESAANSKVEPVSQQTVAAPEASTVADVTEDVQKTAETMKEQVEEVKPQELAAAANLTEETSKSELKPTEPDQLARPKTDQNIRSLTANPNLGNTSKRINGEEKPPAPSADSKPTADSMPEVAFVTLSPNQLDVGEIATGDTGPHPG